MLIYHWCKGKTNFFVYIKWSSFHVELARFSFSFCLVYGYDQQKMSVYEAILVWKDQKKWSTTCNIEF